MTRKKKTAVMTEFHTVKRIDNSRVVRVVEPAKLRNLYKTVALGGILAAFFTLYIYQHFRCIDLSFQLEELKAQQKQAVGLNGELKLEVAALRDPMRIDLMARRHLGLAEPAPAQVREYALPSLPAPAVGAEVAAARFVRPNHAP